MVGPLGAASRSIITLVMTSGCFPKPRLSIRLASYGSHPVATMMAPALSVTLFFCIVRSIAWYSQTSTHFAHSVSRQAESSMAYFIGNAISWAR